MRYFAATLVLAFLLAFLLVSGAAATCGPGDPQTGVPDLDLSIISWGLSAGESATLLVLPDGSGPELTGARRPDGSLVDATVHLQMIDACGNYIANFPRQDMWLESSSGGFVACTGGTIADHNTDPDGRTQWQHPLHAGGHSQSLTYVVVNGAALPHFGLALHFVSPDLSGDRTVSLTDVPAFAIAYFGTYTFAADLHADGVLNLADVAVLAGALGATCP